MIMGPAVIRGKHFFDLVSGEHFPIKGINYYPRPNAGPLTANNIDFFTEQYRHIWERDIPEFVALGINTIRLFAVDPSLNHDAFFCALRNVGIRVIVGLSASCQDCSIQVEAAPDCYPANLKLRGQYIISEFSKYDNVLGFCTSNEIGLALVGTPETNAPCGKQFIRDMKAFIQSCPGMRKIPVGLATADRDRRDNALYYNCRSDPKDEPENVDWYGINSYQHCDGTAKTIDNLKGFIRLRSDFESFGIDVPVVITEFGCINPSFPTIDGYEAQRDFLQIKAIYSAAYVQQFAGGCVFEYSNEDRKTPSPWPYRKYFQQGNFGVGYFSPEFCDDIDLPCEYIHFPQFDILANAFGDVYVDVGDIPSSTKGETLTVPDCPVEFPPLASFNWSSASVKDRHCPNPIGFECPSLQQATSAPENQTASKPVAPRPTTATDNPTSSPMMKPSSIIFADEPTHTLIMPPSSTITVDGPTNTPNMQTIGADTSTPTKKVSTIPISDSITLPSRLCSDHTACLSLSGSCCPTDSNLLLLCCGEVQPSCAQNPFCDALGLVGECCPTTRGFFIDCCTILPGECYYSNRTSDSSVSSSSCVVYSASQYKKDVEGGLFSPTLNPVGVVSEATSGQRPVLWKVYLLLFLRFSF